MNKYKPLLVTLLEEHIRFLERTAYQRSASGPQSQCRLCCLWDFDGSYYTHDV